MLHQHVGGWFELILSGVEVVDTPDEAHKSRCCASVDDTYLMKVVL